MSRIICCILALIPFIVPSTTGADDGCAELVHSSALSYFPEDIAVDGQTALLLNPSDAVEILDLTNPFFPEVVGTWYDTPNLRAVFLAGKTAYLAGGDGLGILDLTDPSHPMEIGSTTEVGDAAAVSVRDGLGFVTSHSSPDLFVVDLSTPQTPEIVGSVPISPQASGSGEIHAWDDHVFVAHSGIKIVNVSNPAEPALIHEFQAVSMSDFAVVDDHLYVVYDFDTSAPKKGFQKTSDDLGLLEIYDISDPDEPQLLGELPLEHATKGVAVMGGLAILGTTWEMYRVDIGDPTQPELIESIDDLGIWEGRMLRTTGPTVVAVQADELQIADFADCLSDVSVSALMGVADVPGRNGTRWSTDLSFCNVSDEPRSGVVDVHLRNYGILNHRISLNLDPWTCQVPSNLESAWSGTAAALRLTFSGPGVLARGRIFNTTEDGSYGYFRTDLDETNAARLEHPVILAPISHSSDPENGFRTNIDLFPMDNQPAEIVIEIHRGDGEFLGSVTVSLNGRIYTQVDNVVEQAGIDEIEGGFAVVRTTTPDVQVLAGASMIDNRSGDASSLPVAALP